MEIISIFSVLIGVGIIIYLKRDAQSSLIKEAVREASHIKTIDLLDYELEHLNQDWKRYGVLSDKEKAFMDALHSRRIDLQKQTHR